MTRDDVRTAQQAIVDALRAGASFSTAHKEGGTTIRFDGRGYVREDYGDSPSTERFADEAALLAFLRRFYTHEITRDASPDVVTEAAAWQWIRRKMDTRPRTASANVMSRLSPAARLAAVFAIVVLLFVVIGTAAWWHEARQASRAAPLLPPPIPALPSTPEQPGARRGAV